MWMIHFYENYDSDKSALIFYGSHALFDGLSVI